MKLIWILVCGAAFGFSIRRFENKKTFGLASAALLLALTFPANAQQTGKIFHIGFLDGSTASGNAGLSAVSSGSGHKMTF